MARAVVVGAAGYSGAELIGLLLGHPEVCLAGLFGSGRVSGGAGGTGDAGPRFDELHPRWSGLTDLRVEPADPERIAGLRPDAVFLATPHEVSHDLAAPLLEHGLTVIDLSGAFRLADPDLYAAHYGFTHRRPDLLGDAVYGLPEVHRAAIATAELIAVPGCYPTSIVLALRPLIEAGACDADHDIVACSTSGVSGAGKTPTTRTHFCEVSLQAYGVFTHRHTPEIERFCGRTVTFTPHIGPYDRGILSTMHLRLAPGWTGAGARDVLRDRYADEPFVRLLPEGTWPAIGPVRGTNRCDIGVAAEGRRLAVVSVIDNLVKGAAGQAMQCMNIRLGLPETSGFQAPIPEHQHA